MQCGKPVGMARPPPGRVCVLGFHQPRPRPGSPGSRPSPRTAAEPRLPDIDPRTPVLILGPRQVYCQPGRCQSKAGELATTFQLPACGSQGRMESQPRPEPGIHFTQPCWEAVGLIGGTGGKQASVGLRRGAGWMLGDTCRVAKGSTPSNVGGEASEPTGQTHGDADRSTEGQMHRASQKQPAGLPCGARPSPVLGPGPALPHKPPASPTECRVDRWGCAPKGNPRPPSAVYSGERSGGGQP